MNKCTFCGREITSQKKESAMKEAPRGVLPRHVWDTKGMVDLIQAIKRYVDADVPVPSEWFEEYKELEAKYKPKPE